MTISKGNSLNPNLLVYIDNSNLFLEGQRTAAVRHHVGGVRTIADAISAGVRDSSWRLNYAALKTFLCGGGQEIAGGAIWGSVGRGQSLQQIVGSSGMPVRAIERNSRGKEKGVDITIAMAVMEDTLSGRVRAGVDEVTLVSGDGDFTPLVQTLVAKGITVDVVFWSHAAKGLISAASRFVCLDPFLDYLTYRPTPTTASMGVAR